MARRRWQLHALRRRMAATSASPAGRATWHDAHEWHPHIFPHIFYWCTAVYDGPVRLSVLRSVRGAWGRGMLTCTAPRSGACSCWLLLTPAARQQLCLQAAGTNTMHGQAALGGCRNGGCAACMHGLLLQRHQGGKFGHWPLHLLLLGPVHLPPAQTGNAFHRHHWPVPLCCGEGP